MLKNEIITKKFLSRQRLVDLLDEWEIVCSVANTPDVETVRGWLLDEIKSRNPDAFREWLEDGACDNDLAWFMSI